MKVKSSLNPKIHREKLTFGQRLSKLEAEEKKEKEDLEREYFHSGKKSKTEIKALHKRRIAYAKKFKKDAVTGIPRKY